MTDRPNPPLRWARVSFAGRLAMVTPSAAREAIELAGGAVQTNLTRLSTHLVIGMRRLPLHTDGRVAGNLRRAQQLRRSGRRIAVLSELTFLELVGLRDQHAELDRPFGRREAADLIGVPLARLDEWESFGLTARGADGRYDFRDLVALQTILELTSTGVALDTIARGIAELFQSLPETERPLSELQVIAEQRANLLARHRGDLMTTGGQFVLDYDPPGTAGITIDLQAHHETAEAWFDHGQLFEDAGEMSQAIDAYRRAVELLPSHHEAWFNLGVNLHAQGAEEEAMASYRRSIQEDPGFALAWYNLADLLEDRGDTKDAEQALRSAIDADPDYADPHYNLALLLESTGRAIEARSHWSNYLQCDSTSQWALLAKQRLEADETPNVL